MVLQIANDKCTFYLPQSILFLRVLMELSFLIGEGHSSDIDWAKCCTWKSKMASSSDFWNEAGHFADL